jgi:ureidoglycolate lyase
LILKENVADPSFSTTPHTNTASTLPLDPAPFLIVVAPAGPAPGSDALRAFVTDGRQGVNYARGVWHHPVIAIDRESDFLVVDRGGPGDNLVEVRFSADQAPAVVLPPD